MADKVFDCRLSKSFRRDSIGFQGWKQYVLSVWRRIWQIGSDDSRRIVHSLKVGVALFVVSLFYRLSPLFDSIGENGVWVVMTVVVVFEFTAGATLSKGLNRCLATFGAGALGFAVGYLAKLTGQNGGRIVLGVSVFVIGSASTFLRFIPTIKKRYDYGVAIFILTFSLIAISSCRVESPFKMAYQRIVATMIGCALCFLISLLVFPIWAGDDLHNLIVCNLEALAGSIEDCAGEYFNGVKMEDGKESEQDEPSNGYKSPLNSKTSEESWINFASWEPYHGKFFMGYPWNEYVNVRANLRYCAYSVDALNGLLNSDIKPPRSLKECLKKPCTEICVESGYILRDLAKSTKTMTKITNKASMIRRLETLVLDLKRSLSSLPELFVSSTQPSEIVQEKCLQISKIQKILGSFTTALVSAEIEKIEDVDKTHQHREYERTGLTFSSVDVLGVATFGFLVIEIAARLESVILAVVELAEKAKFTNMEINEASQMYSTREVEVEAAAMSILAAESMTKIDIIEDLDQKKNFT